VLHTPPGYNQGADHGCIIVRSLTEEGYKCRIDSLAAAGFMETGFFKGSCCLPRRDRQKEREREREEGVSRMNVLAVQSSIEHTITRDDLYLLEAHSQRNRMV
jgi:hypothetical protein